MNIFISWSGDKSKEVAELLDEWIQCVLQAVRPWISSKDIDRGSLWFSEISDQLRDTRMGIVCLTKANQEKPWILFEAGALAKGLSSSRICTFLIDLEPADVGNPLAQFNHTTPDRDDVYELVRTLNSSLDEHALRERVLEQVFETYWPQFEKRFQKILEQHPIDESIPARSEESMMSELVRTVRSLDRRVRGMERKRDVVRQRSDHRANYVSPAALREEAKEYIENGVPADIAAILLEGKGPSTAIERFIKQAVRELEEGGIDDGSD